MARKRNLAMASAPMDSNNKDVAPMTADTADGVITEVLQNKSSGMRDESDIQKENLGEVASAVIQSTVPAWINIVVIVGLIFGGCCANVYALEALVVDDPSAGALITFTQFFVVAIFTLPTILSFSAGIKSFFMVKPNVPLKDWAIYTLFFLTVNLLNNSVFIFKISVPLHIIIRSAGPVASMLIGYLYNSRRYSRNQVISVTILSAGVVAAALADAHAKGKSLDLGIRSDSDASSLALSLAGFSVLGVAMLLAAFQGVYADRLYQKHGRDNWREGLFYSHALSLPFLLPSSPKLYGQLKSLAASPSVMGYLESIASHSASSLLTINATSPAIANTISSIPVSVPSTSPADPLTFSKELAAQAIPSLVRSLSTNAFFQPVLTKTPIKLVYLGVNAFTQYLCIRGVYLLSAKTSSLTVVIVLNIRKLVSLMLSVYLFGNVLTTGALAGAACVFIGGGIYAAEGARLRKKAQKDKIV
ncbi:golgi uridine diphosphate-N- acetylglucosamine transporter [Myotisia sp. PD_48]|nr:golgi uridine diphosphate-N- acetylglucosamine transporter [Myotisia sp. PD_48]